MDYYRMRKDDFTTRNPGETPPDYYMGYGDRYVHRFVAQLRPKLSYRGKDWLDCTLVALQRAIEDRRDENTWAFAALEDDNEAFRVFAYSTHPSAYVKCGICSQFLDDDIAIMLTPDLTDLLGKDGRAQITEALDSCVSRWSSPWWWAFGG